ncbi:MAG: hypothetical protein HY054_05760 [Proteobacteria bacterium]|nr:hypothetical protein [Pseudomonadota bacterium]
MSWTLCIDFGTAFSKAAVAPSNSWNHFEPGLIRPLMLGGENQGANTFLLPSAVFVDDERVLFGPAAIARAAALADQKRAALKSFKTLLSVSDLDRALNTRLPTSIDPHHHFSMGDLITLYLAYLGASIDRAIAADPVLERFAAFSRRYAAPAWRGADGAKPQPLQRTLQLVSPLMRRRSFSRTWARAQPISRRSLASARALRNWRMRGLR